MKTIGETLQKARTHKHLSIDDVNARTRIPHKYIEALEDGNPSVFPAEVYCTGSLRRYAEFLGLDVHELMMQYRDIQKSARLAFEKAEDLQKKQNTTQPNIYVAIAAVLVLVLIAGVFVVMLTTIKPAPNPPAEPIVPEISSMTVTHPVQQPAAASRAAVAITTGTLRHVQSVSPALVPAAPAAERVTAGASSVKVSTAIPAVKSDNALFLVIQSRKDTWMRTTLDGVLVFDGILPTGGRKEWSARDKIAIQLGYSTGVSAVLNGHALDVRTLAQGDMLVLTRETIAGLQQPEKQQ